MPTAHTQLSEDHYLGPLISKYGVLELDPADDMFQRLVVSVIRQQISMAAAAAIQENLFTSIEITPATVLATDPETFRNAGLSQAKTKYIKNAAAAFQDGLSKSYFEDLDDATVIAELTEIKGIGEWTAHMQLMFSLGREDVFPVGDLGVRNGMNDLFNQDMSRQEMVEEASQWAPYRSYATLYLWRLEEDIAAAVAEVRSEQSSMNR